MVIIDRERILKQAREAWEALEESRMLKESCAESEIGEIITIDEFFTHNNARVEVFCFGAARRGTKIVKDEDGVA
ncbi:MAG TPA: hypothetical protein ENN12_05860 [Epsilonproteobacteria bacterium]|nr:hypothetical protein [Campylobacterota bacterium]